MFDRLRLLFAKATQGVCGGVEETGVGFQQWSVAGSQARKEDRVRSVASGHAILGPPNHQSPSQRIRRHSSFCVRSVKYWNKLRTSLVTDPFVDSFERQMDSAWSKMFPRILVQIPPLSFKHLTAFYPVTF